MTGYKEFIYRYGAILCSLLLMVFSFFIPYSLPVRLISFASLIAASLIIAKDLRSPEDFKKIFGRFVSANATLLFCATGLAAGILFAILYRWHLGIRLFPGSLRAFAYIAALIGCVEELVYRGYVQVSANRINATFSIFFSSISHTGYKCCLFFSPAIVVSTNIGFLAFWTFIAGIILGTIRHISNSIYPTLAAHILFDILVYGEYVAAPWWVW